MIKAQELRIGNLVMAQDDYLHAHCHAKVIMLNEHEMRWQSITKNLNEHTVQSDIFVDVEGIELSEDWLKRMGFEKRPNLHFNYYEIEIEVNAPGHTIQDKRSITVNENRTHCFVDGTFAAEVRHVHTLQNIFYALTGAELEIK
jgi:hypothetical protein